ncbi:thymidylate kinase [Hippoglossus hippoglossus]|uniref:thymidylate kinase n=1 Tax=Hippoglossus hippoglossus TaxID=8267 RepID=UPI00148C39CE|nr:thymidylate kinase [Hippoglossus hippoglossus]XP_035032289.1 thymidylate kinase [Hippoglossus stenolepis]
MACKRGALIVLEGVDKAGKTTQCQKLLQALQQSGQSVEMMRFPDRSTTIGQLISAYLQKKSDLEDHTVHLLFSANRWEMVPLMKEKLEQGTTLVVDRYAFSGVAFTSAKPGFCLDWCMKPDVGLPKPDLVMFLQLSPVEAALRGQFGEERYETSIFQREVQRKFEELMKDPSVNWQVIDASKSVDDVHKDITTHSLDTINTAQNLPLGKLWK